ncbi:MAG: penicillin-binding protein [Clostridiaceae bacterium]|nr:penicillin-binding protein [Clostridiaceae bacterium]
MKLINSISELIKSKQKKPKREKPLKIKKEKAKTDVTGKQKSPALNALSYCFKVLWGSVKLILLLFIMVCFVGAGLVSGLVYGYIETTPALNASDLQIKNYNTFIYDSEGNVLAELKGSENRVWIDYAEIPTNLIKAFIAVEDKRFWEHKGVDFRRFLYATYISAKSYLLKQGDDIQGGSTITQQLVKNLTGNKDLTPKRKIQEVWQALKLERDGLSKEDILTRYLNTVPLGSTIYGIETAAQAYFGKNVRDLSLAECASLAGITQYPSQYMPNTEENKKKNIERAHMILGLMLEQNLIIQEEYDQAIQEEIKLIFNPGAGKVTKTSIQTYFVDEVIKSVKQDLSEYKGVSLQTAEDMLYNSGLRIYTTLVPKVQAALDEVYTDKNYFPDVNEEARLREEIPQSAMVVIDPATGAVCGLYGGFGEKKGSVFNRATQMFRSPGSSIKPLLVYGPGIEEKLITTATLVDDVPQHMRLNDFSIPEKEREQIYPQNVERINFGLTTVHVGLVHSRNVVSALLLRDFVGFKTALTFMEKVGLPRWEDDGIISISMGGFTNRMSPLQMAAAYSVFSYKGLYWEPYYYTRIEDYDGNVILEKNPNWKKIYSEQTSFIINEMLQDVVRYGTAKGYGIKNKNGEDIPTAGKTGTSDKYIDKWFCGSTPYYCAATWFGYDNARVPISLSKPEYSNALKIWNAVMTKIHEDLEPKPFFDTMPANIVKRKVCLDSGKLATNLCEQDPRGSRVTELYFIDGTEPDYGDTCKVHYKASVCSACKDEFGRPVLANEYCPAETVTERVFIRRPVEYKPLFPTDPYPEDWKYEIYEGEYCTVHDSYSTPGTDFSATYQDEPPEPTEEPTPTPFYAY